MSAPGGAINEIVHLRPPDAALQFGDAVVKSASAICEGLLLVTSETTADFVLGEM